MDMTIKVLLLLFIGGITGGMGYFRGKARGEGRPRDFQRIPTDIVFRILFTHHYPNELISDELLVVTKDCESKFQYVYLIRDQLTVDIFLGRKENFFLKTERGDYIFGNEDYVARRTQLREVKERWS